jgi:hypothetical protein
MKKADNDLVLTVYSVVSWIDFLAHLAYEMNCWIRSFSRISFIKGMTVQYYRKTIFIQEYVINERAADCRLLTKVNRII